MNTKIFLSALVAFAVTPAASQYALAADDNANASSLVEEIVVTARKREETWLEVPMSVTAFSGDNLKQLGAINFEDYGKRVPGLNFVTRDAAGFRGGAGTAINIRGVSGSVGFYLNEVAIPTVNLKLVDIQRVEVLKGPQGTLYGSSAMGGLLKTVTNQPTTDQFEANVHTDLSSTDGGGFNYQIDGAVNIPLVDDRLALRVVAYRVDNEGYVDRLPGAFSLLAPPPPDLTGLIKNEDDELTQGGRVALKFTPSDALSFTAGVIYEKAETEGRSEWDRPLAEFYGRDFINGSPTREWSESEFTNAYLTIDYSIGDWANFTSSTAYTDLETLNFEEFDYFVQAVLGLPLPAVDSRPTLVARNIFSQEVRVSSTGDSRFNWLAGAFYQNIESDPSLQAYIGSPIGVFVDQRAIGSFKEFGLFAEFSYEIIDRLTATVGMRYFDMENYGEDRRTGLLGGDPFSVTHAKDNGFNPKVGLSWQATDEMMVFAQAVKGFRPGAPIRAGVFPDSCDAQLAQLGFDPNNLPAQLDPDSLWTYELGAKMSLLDQRLTLDGAVYYTDWKDKPEAVFLNSCGFTIQGNLGEAVVKGIELNAIAHLTDSLLLQVAAGYEDAESAKDAPAFGLVKGQQLELTSKYQLAASLEYRRPVFAGLDGVARLDFTHRGDMVGISFGGHVLESYSSANFRLGVHGDNWGATVYVDNLTNEVGDVFDISGQLLTAAAFRVRSIRPRTFGVSINRSF